MSAPTINANAAILLNIQLMIGSFSFAHSSVATTQSPTFCQSKQLNNNCSQVDCSGPASRGWYCVVATSERQQIPLQHADDKANNRYDPNHRRNGYHRVDTVVFPHGLRHSLQEGPKLTDETQRDHREPGGNCRGGHRGAADLLPHAQTLAPLGGGPALIRAYISV